MKITIKLILLLLTLTAHAASPVCNEPGENYISWPTVDPVWEMCYLAANESSAADGSSLEIRKIHFNGILAMERIHVPMLFASYETQTCYRDWKNTNAQFLKANAIDNPSQSAITTCDASTVNDKVVGDCPFRDPNDPSGNTFIGDPADCFSGVQIEKFDNRMVLTTNHSAAWYKYTARYIFHADGRIQPRFGFANSTGNLNSVNHWHTGYWRMNFDIDGPDNDEIYVYADGTETLKTEEFSDLRHNNGVERTGIYWTIKDSVTGRGFKVVPETEGDAQLGFVDEFALTNNPSGRNFHMTDVMATRYKLINGTLTEYSDTPGQNTLHNCDMIETNLVGDENNPNNLPETLVDENLVFWYRTAVWDQANMGMLCKTGGPTLYPVGNWGGVDIPPTAVVDAFQVEENSMDNVFDVMSNDTDPDGGSNVITSVTQPNNGTVVINNNTELLYSPSIDYCNDEMPTDDFTYTLNGGSEGQVSVSVSCVDDDLIFESGFERLPTL